MKLCVEMTAEAGIEACFKSLSDFDEILKTGKAGKIHLTRLDAPAPICDASSWTGQLEVHGLRKPVSIEVETLRPPDGYCLSGKTDGLSARFSMALSPKTPEQTDVRAEIKLRATTIPGKLLLKSLQLVQGSLEERLADRLARLLRA